MKNFSIKKKVAIIAIITVFIVSAIAIVAFQKLDEPKTEVVGAVSKKLEMKEEVAQEVKEEVIIVTQDTTEDVKPEEEVEFEDKKVSVPKSTVAPANSSEDAERNKKNGGSAVSQAQAENMFESVGTKSFGIDVSAHQGRIDWSAVKASGVDFAIIRCGFRGQTAGAIYEDAYFKTNVTAANAAGVKVGIYFYSTALNENEALEEAAWVVKKISTYRITYPVVYDFEDFGAYRCANVGGAQATSNALTFLNFVKANGYEPMMYANKNDITTRMSRGSFSCKFWLAHYTSQTDYTGNINMWQYTSKGSVPGISGNVDMDIAYFSYGGTADAKHTHNFNELVKNTEKLATCTTNGNKTMRCSCGETEVQTIPATGHKYGNWVTEKEATTESDGLKVRTCADCGNRETQKIDKLPSKPTNTTNTNTNTVTDENNGSVTNTTPNENTTTPSTNTTPGTPPETNTTVPEEPTVDETNTTKPDEIENTTADEE